MEQSMRRFMKVGLVLHAAYRGLGDGGGPILECLGKVVQDDYFDAVEVAHIQTRMSEGRRQGLYGQDIWSLLMAGRDARCPRA